MFQVMLALIFGKTNYEQKSKLT